MSEGRTPLARCPFCGAEASIEAHGSIFRDGSGVGYRIECAGRCHAMTCYWHAEADAVAHWNQRTATSEGRTPLEDLQREWRRRADDCERMFLVPQATLLRGCADELAAACRETPPPQVNQSLSVPCFTAGVASDTQDYSFNDPNRCLLRDAFVNERGYHKETGEQSWRCHKRAGHATGNGGRHCSTHVDCGAKVQTIDGAGNPILATCGLPPGHDNNVHELAACRETPQEKICPDHICPICYHPKDTCSHCDALAVVIDKRYDCGCVRTFEMCDKHKPAPSPEPSVSPQKPQADDWQPLLPPTTGER